MTPDPAAIVAAYGGHASGDQIHVPAIGHSRRDRGVSIRIGPQFPDGCLVNVFNGTDFDAIAFKDDMRRKGLIPARPCDERGREWQPRRFGSDVASALVEAEKTKRRDRQIGIAREAAEVFRNASPADPAHPYLVAKRASPERLRQHADQLLVPMHDVDGRLWNLQRIYPDGRKLFLKDGRTKGLFWLAGMPEDAICIGEGVATMKAVRRALGVPVAAAMSAGNLPAAACAIRSRLPDAKITICADDDAKGIAAAQEAARLSGAAVAVPGVTA